MVLSRTPKREDSLCVGVSTSGGDPLEEEDETDRDPASGCPPLEGVACRKSQCIQANSCLKLAYR